MFIFLKFHIKDSVEIGSEIQMIKDTQVCTKNLKRDRQIIWNDKTMLEGEKKKKNALFV